MTQLNFGRDVQGYNAFAPQISDTMFSATILQGTAARVVTPSNNENWIAVFSYQPGSDVWVAVNFDAEPPVGADFSSTNSFLLPAQLKVRAGDDINCYNNSASAVDVGIAFYAVP